MTALFLFAKFIHMELITIVLLAITFLLAIHLTASGFRSEDKFEELVFGVLVVWIIAMVLAIVAYIGLSFLGSLL